MKIAGEVNVSSALLILPVAHLAVASLYIISYCYGIGGNVIALVRPGDIFSISIQKLALIYLFSLGFPIFLTWIRHRSGTPYAEVAIARLEGDGHREAVRRHRSLKIIMFCISLLLAVFGALASWHSVTNGNFFTLFPLIASFSGIFFIILYRLGSKFGFGGMGYDIFVNIIYFVISTFGIGFDSGVRDVHSKYYDLVSHSARCNDGVILSKIGEQYFVVLPDGSKAVMGVDCKVVIFLPKRAELG